MRRKSRDLFTILVREHEFRLLAYVRACVADPATADDIVQESFIAAWRKLTHYDRRRPFALWLQGIARNKILEHMRNAATANRYVAQFTSELIDLIGDEQEHLTSSCGDTFLDQLRPLQECLSALRYDDRDILDRHYARKQTCRAISEQLTLKAETIKKRLQRLREALHECILGKLAREAERG